MSSTRSCGDASGSGSSGSSGTSSPNCHSTDQQLLALSESGARPQALRVPIASLDPAAPLALYAELDHR
eukprot:5315213-Prymnesium_polylepis.1